MVNSKRSTNSSISKITKPMRRPVSTFKRGIYQVYKINPKYRRKAVAGWYDLTIVALLIMAAVAYFVI